MGISSSDLSCLEGADCGEDGDLCRSRGPFGEDSRIRELIYGPEKPEPFGVRMTGIHTWQPDEVATSIINTPRVPTYQDFSRAGRNQLRGGSW
jgi:hypothetical protein